MKIYYKYTKKIFIYTTSLTEELNQKKPKMDTRVKLKPRKI